MQEEWTVVGNYRGNVYRMNFYANGYGSRDGTPIETNFFWRVIAESRREAIRIVRDAGYYLKPVGITLSAGRRVPPVEIGAVAVDIEMEAQVTPNPEAVRSGLVRWVDQYFSP